MAEITIPSGTLHNVANVLAAMASLTPPPEPKGRYVLARALPAIQKAAEEHGKAFTEFLQGAATKKDDGTPNITAHDNGTLSFVIASEHLEAYRDIQSLPTAIPGVRMITHAELGACPITIEQEAVLITAGLLADEEPA